MVILAVEPLGLVILTLTTFTLTLSITSKEILNAEFPEPKWVVNGLIPEGLTILAGKPKLGKSWLTLQIAAAASVGVPALFHFECEPMGVLYLALEDTDRRLKQRLNLIGALPSDRLKFIIDSERNLPGIKAIKSRLELFPETRLVIIDTLARFLPEFDFNDYSQTYPAMQSLKALSDKFGIGIVAIHHTRKSSSDDYVDTVTGSNAFTGVADTIMILSRNRGTADGFIQATGRDIDELDIALELVKDQGWRYMGAGDEYRMSQERKEIFDLLKDAKDQYSARDIAGIIGKKEPNVRYLLSKMANDGQIKKVARGVYEAYIG